MLGDRLMVLHAPPSRFGGGGTDLRIVIGHPTTKQPHERDDPVGVGTVQVAAEEAQCDEELMSDDLVSEEFLLKQVDVLGVVVKIWIRQLDEDVERLLVPNHSDQMQDFAQLVRIAARLPFDGLRETGRQLRP